jgi:hypothetical protein
MILEIRDFINNINMGYVILMILFLIVSLLFLLKKKNILNFKLFLLGYFVLFGGGLLKLNDLFNNIFKLNYLSVKLYLVLLIIGNVIMLVSINFEIKRSYKMINLMLFITNFMIAIVNILIVISNKFNFFVLSDLDATLKLMNINYIIFLGYLYCLCLIYIIEYVISIIKDKIKLKKKNVIDNNDIYDKAANTNVGEEKNKYSYSFKGEEVKDKGFYIDGVDCSAIFEDDNKENVSKNYYILLNDVNAKLTNGYTIKEYTKIKDILRKLRINDFNDFNFDSNELEKISSYEYNLLKKYIRNKKRFE